MQQKKEEIRAKIFDAGLKKFAEKGFLNTRMSDIAKEAGVSVGNIYRYFMNKEDLFYSILTPAIVHKYKKLLVEQFKKASQQDLAKQGTFFINEEFIHFIAQYRLHDIIAFEGSQGTLYENLPEETLTLREQLFVPYLQNLSGRQEIELSESDKILVRILYNSFFKSILAILKRYDNPETIAEILRDFFTYHNTGLARLFYTKMNK